MARIGLNITITGLTGFLIIRWVKASAPLAEVGRSAAFPFDYDDVYNITDLQPVVYIVQLWRSDDGVALDQLIKDWAIDASVYNEATISTTQYKVDRGWNNTAPVATGPEVWADPVDTDTELTDERLDGATKDELIVHEAGYGNLLDAEYELKPGGGIILQGGRTFNADTPWFITRSQIVANIVTTPAGTNTPFEGVSVLTADRDFYISDTDNLYNRLVIANWPGSVGVVTFPDLSLIPDGVHVTFNTHQGSQNYLRLQFDAGDTVKYLGQDVNVIDVAKGQKISLYFNAGVAYVTDEPANALKRGMIVADYDGGRAAATGAYIAADEATGELLEADYPGLYAWTAALPAGTVPLGTSAGQWSYDSGGGVYPNKRFYGIQTTGTLKMRVPHLIGVSAKFGASAAAGEYEADNVGSFSGEISMPKGHSYTGAPNQARMGNGANNPVDFAIPFEYVSDIEETRVKSVIQIPYVVL